AVVFSIRKARRGKRTPAPVTAGNEGAAERPVLRESEKNGHSTADAALVHWSPQTLRTILADELPGAQVIVVSNREPYIHNASDNGIELVVPASGLVSA